MTHTIADGRRSIVMLLALMLALTTVAATAPPAQADSHLSDGCALVASSGPHQSSVSSFGLFAGLSFYQDEVVSATFSDPSTGGVTEVSMSMDVEPFDGFERVDEDGFPGSVSYTIPADGKYKFSFSVQGDNPFIISATIDPDCQGAAPPAPPFCESGRVFGEFHSSQAQDGGLNHKPGSHHGFASCLHGEDFNNGNRNGPKTQE